MSEVKVNKISPRTNCGTVQLGDSGDTITIPAGATITNNGTQTGFGREGSVNWQTSIKTTSFTAVSGEGYFVNTTSAALTVTLPASPSAGAIVSVKDYANTADTNNITIARNGSNIDGGTDDVVMTTEGIAVTLVYADATKGWLVVDSGQKSDLIVPAFVAATGGNCTTTCGNFKVHIFTSPGTFCVSSAGNAAGSNSVDYLVVAGGGGGGQNTPYGGTGAGAGGAGGFRLSNSTCMPAPITSPLAATCGVTVTATAFPITVGAGGAGSPSAPGFRQGTSGSNSIFSSITSAGGGGGGSGGCSPTTGPGVAGGSGGGASAGAPAPETRPGGAGNTPPVSPPQGSSGGSTHPPSCGGDNGGAGGGGASAAGGNTTENTAAGVGGAGSFVLNGNGFAGTQGTSGPVTDARYFSGGGGGGSGGPSSTKGIGGVGGGGDGACKSTSNSENGTVNTGGGGGGGNWNDPYNGGTGGSGIVIIRYKFQ
jgi:hypothetical protein